MSADNRLTADQLAVLAPGDSVTIECSGDSRRPRYVAGTVVRIAGSQIIVRVKSARGVIYQQRYGLRDGIRDGKSLTRAELVNGDSQSYANALLPIQRIDVLYREWARARADVDKLLQLHAAIAECLNQQRASDTASARRVPTPLPMAMETSTTKTDGGSEPHPLTVRCWLTGAGASCVSERTCTARRRGAARTWPAASSHVDGAVSSSPEPSVGAQ